MPQTLEVSCWWAGLSFVNPFSHCPHSLCSSLSIACYPHAQHTSDPTLSSIIHYAYLGVNWTCGHTHTHEAYTYPWRLHIHTHESCMYPWVLHIQRACTYLTWINQAYTYPGGLHVPERLTQWTYSPPGHRLHMRYAFLSITDIICTNTSSDYCMISCLFSAWQWITHYRKTYKCTSGFMV